MFYSYIKTVKHLVYGNFYAYDLCEKYVPAVLANDKIITNFVPYEVHIQEIKNRLF